MQRALGQKRDPLVERRSYQKYLVGILRCAWLFYEYD